VLATPDMGHDAETAAAIRELVTKGGGNGLICSVDDCRKTYEELLEKGVEFMQEPTEHFLFGPAVFRPPLRRRAATCPPARAAPGRGSR
jgi:hypothetical protein